jgi:integrase
MIKAEHDALEQWPVWAASFQPHIPGQHLVLFDRFVAWMKKRAPAVWAGLAQLSLAKEDHAALRKALCVTAQSAASELSLMDWWDRLIAAGNQSNQWDIPLLPPIVRLPPVRPDFVRRDFLLLHSFRQIEAALLTRLQEELQPSQMCDAILCSTIINGGVVSRPMLCAIASIDAASISGYAGELRATLRIPTDKTEYTEQIWYPDALTSVLITRTLKLPGAFPARVDTLGPTKLPTRINEAFDKLGLPFIDWSNLLRAAHVALKLSVPPYIAAYLSDELPSQSLPDDVLRRLCGWRREVPDQATASSDTTASSLHGDFIDVDVSYDPKAARVDQIKVINTVLALLEKESKHPIEKIDQETRRHGAGLWPITRLLLEWTKWHLGGHDDDPHSSGRKRIEKSSAVRYLRTIGRHLITVAEDENLLEMEAEDFESLYELSAARVIRRKERDYFWGRIASFHLFLTLAGAPEINIRELDGYEAAGQRRVSANLVGEPDFLAFKRSVMAAGGWGPDTPHLRILLAAILGIRCGLRRREVQMLQLHDVHPEPDPYLVIRSSEFARLKSHSSHRRLPLHALLPEDELGLLLDYVSKRKEGLVGHTGLVFSRQGEPLTPLPDTELFAPITAAFQVIIGLETPRFRFHHLRHSFANWLFLALVGIDNPEIAKASTPLPTLSPFRGNRIAPLSEALFPRLLGTPPAPTRKNLYIVSSLLGHLSPLTTCRSYLHIIDWLAGRELDVALGCRLANLGAGQLGAICGLSPSMPHKLPYRDLLNQPVAFLRRYVQQQLPPIRREVVDEREWEPANRELGRIFTELGTPVPPPPVILLLVLARLQRQEEADILSRCYTVSRNAIDSAALHYQRLYAKQSVATPKKRIRFPGPPRQLDAAKEFWRILDQTSQAFSNGDANTRRAMIAAARLLIQRNGPKTGRLYFGEKQESAPEIVRGLIAMGVPAAGMMLEVRTPDRQHEVRSILDEVITIVEKLGVRQDHTNLDWPKRAPKGPVLRLHFLPTPDTGMLKETVLSNGKIHGINYAAIWILFASTGLSHQATPAQ